MTNRPCLLASLGIAFGSMAAQAQPVSGAYVHLGGGVDLLQNEDVKPSGFGPTPRHYTFDPGSAAIVAVGYGLGNGLRLEVEGSYSYSHVHGVEFPSQYLPERAGGHQQQYGGFGNVLYDLRLRLPVTPYFGVGAGYREIELDHINSGSTPASSAGRRGICLPRPEETSPIRASPASRSPLRCADCLSPSSTA